MRIALSCLVASLAFAIAAPATFAQSPTTTAREDLLVGRTASEPMLNAIGAYLDRTQKKIVGGRPAKPGQFPWQVALLVTRIPDPFDAHFCGGSVHSDRWIVTAAHCVYGTDAADVAIVAGEHALKGAPKRLTVRRIFVHEAYDSETEDNDIALLELERPLALGQNIRAIPLLGAAEEPRTLKRGVPLVVSGWGLTQQDGEGAYALHYVEVPFVERKTCNRPLFYDGAITEKMICAGLAVGGKDSCNGDSGGPLSVGTGARPILAGVVSWGEGCAQPNKVGVYTRISQFTDWISACIAHPDTCKTKP